MHGQLPESLGGAVYLHTRRPRPRKSSLPRQHRGCDGRLTSFWRWLTGATSAMHSSRATRTSTSATKTMAAPSSTDQKG